MAPCGWHAIWQAQATKDVQGLLPSLSVISEVEKSSSSKAHEHHFAERETGGAIPSQEEGGGGTECARRLGVLGFAGA